MAISCSHLRKAEFRPLPEFKGIDPELKPYVDDYFNLSKRYNLEFKGSVSMGFKKIDREPVIGTCYISSGFREIEIDKPYWDRASFIQRKALVFHELTHCYCKRMHDFGDGTEYEDETLKKLFEILMSKVPFRPEPRLGYYDDNCPMSIMAPEIPYIGCLKKYEKEYFQEMFNRCKPY